MTRDRSPEYKRNRAQLLAGSPPCHWCGTSPATEADHLVPYDVEPDDSITNLVPSCRSCNASRGATYGNLKRHKQHQARRNVHLAHSDLEPEGFFEPRQTQVGS